MVRGGLLGIILLVLLLVPSVSAALSMTCPYPSGTTAQATHPFNIRADDPSASTIKLKWQGSWHTYTGTYGIGTITEPISMEHNRAYYDAQSFDSSGTLLASKTCEVYIDSENFPGTVSASPPSLQLVIGQGASVTVSADDDDGISYVKLGTNSYSCYNFGGYPSSCQHAFTVSYSAAGTYYVTPSVQDKWGNLVSGSPVTVTVTDPCENYNCDDGNACTTDECVAVNGQPTCQHGNQPTTFVCSNSPPSHCDGQGSCLVDCSGVASSKCLGAPPGGSYETYPNYCSASATCYACESGFHWEGNDCVADISCSNECSSGEMQCSDTDHEQSCVFNSASGCWEWDAPVACPQGETCTGGACTDPCAGLPACSAAETGHERCNANVVETCGQPDGTCWQWTTTQSCAAPTPYCVQSGNAASCVACRDDSDCNAGEVCSSGSCCADSDGDGVCDTPDCSDASECTSNPYDQACSSVACTNGMCDYSKANEGGACALDGGTGVCQAGSCVGCVTNQDCNDTNACTTDTCSGNECSYAAVAPVCPAPSSVACGQPITSTNGCGSCTGSGTQCAADQACLDSGGWACHDCLAAAPQPSDVSCGETATGLLCTGGTYSVSGTGCNQSQVCNNGVCEATDFTILQDDLTYVVPNTVVLTPVLSAPSGVVPLHYFDYAGWMTSNTKNVGNADVGTYHVTITAYRQIGGTLAVTNPPISVYIQCNPADPNYGPCCDQGTYRPDGSSCVHEDTDPGETWQCSQGQCVEYCTPHASEGCVGTMRYWYDSCGNQGDAIHDCAVDGEVCVENDGGTQCVLEPPACSGEYEYFCRDNDVWRRDTGCGHTELQDSCGANEVCEEQGDQAWCEARGPCDTYPGTILCGDSCVDPLTDRLDCGGCGRTCGRNEQCVQGACALIPGCVVVCDSNEECGAGYVCVNAGDCTESRCEPVTMLQPPEDAERLASQLTDGIVQVDVALGPSYYTFTAYNLGPSVLENVTVTAAFQKLLARSADKLIVQDVPYTVVEQDPVLAFHLPPFTGTLSWVVNIQYAENLDPSYADLVSILGIAYQKPDLLAAWNATKDALTLGLNTEFDGENTKFHLTLDPSKELGALSVPLEIPKCMAQYANQLQLEGNYHIVKDDPLIVWRFDELHAPTEITFSVPGDIDEECKRQLKAMAYAGRIGRPISPWLAILLVPLIGVLLIFFQRFTPETRERLSKAEFTALAKEQGQSDDEIDREWRDYKRRF